MKPAHVRTAAIVILACAGSSRGLARQDYFGCRDGFDGVGSLGPDLVA